MHSLGSNSNIPTFILKLWKLVCDESSNDLICWNRNGRSFIIKDQGRFAKEMLPLYFKHSNMASFIRQLNMYGFRKVSNIEHSGLKSDGDEVEFFHHHFYLGQENELQLIKRKMSTTNNSKCLTSIVKVDEIQDILADVESIKGRQDSVDSLLNNLKQENEALWREIAILRQKHLKQQQIVEKLLQFLVSIVRNRVVGGLKRKAPLLIDSNSRKIIKNKDSIPICIPSPQSNSGPIIHDITDLEESSNNLRNDSVNNDSLLNGLQFNLNNGNNDQKSLPTLNSNQTPSLIAGSVKTNNLPNVKDTIIDLPQISETDLVANHQVNNPSLVNYIVQPSQSHSNYNIDNADNIINEADLLKVINHVQPSVAAQPTTSNQSINNFSTDLIVPSKQKPTNSTNFSKLTSENFNDHVEGIDTELNWLQDQLYGGSINVDPSTLVGLFSLDNQMASNQLAGLDTGSTNDTNTIPKAIMDGDQHLQLMTNNTNQNQIVKIEDDNSNSSLFENLDLSNIGNDTKGLSQLMFLWDHHHSKNRFDSDILSEFTSDIDSSHFN